MTATRIGESSGQAHPYLYFTAYAIKDSLISSEAQEKTLIAASLVSECAALKNERAFKIPIDICPADPLNPVHRSALDKANNMLQEIGQPTDATAPAREKYIEFRDQVLKALQELKIVWPNMATEIFSTIKQIVGFQASTAIGFADVRAHGSIFLRIGKAKSHIELLEDIVHESSHVALNAILSSGKFYNNDENSLYITPLRKDPRPIFGLLHQVFVLRRLKHLYQQFQPYVNENNFSEITARFQAVSSSYDAATKTLQENMQVTVLGRSLLNSFRE